MDFLYHYTSVDVLALILSCHSIRFNALNKVDDLQEQETNDIKNLGRFCFVSCWTEDSKESIPMWKMYGDLKSGVRVGMKKHPFLEKENRPEELNKVLGQGVVDDKTGGFYIKSLITSAEMMEKQIISTGLVQQKDILYKVEYTTEHSKLYPQVLSQGEEGTTLSLGELGKYKNIGWEFQKEWRYCLLLLPLDIREIDKAAEKGVQMMKQMIEGNASLPFSHYDLQIDEDAYESMEITLSPRISHGNRIIVENLVEKYNPMARIVESDYKGLIA